jgi:hypothetical protein
LTSPLIDQAIALIDPEHRRNSFLQSHISKEF